MEHEAYRPGAQVLGIGAAPPRCTNGEKRRKEK